jgi:outer membrane protein assembly factor BamB
LRNVYATASISKLALADGTLYLVGHHASKEECKGQEFMEPVSETRSRNDLISLDAATGKINWTWRPAGQDYLARYSAELAVTSDTVFVRGNENTYAVSAASHQQVWKINKVGSLALGKGKLVISDYDNAFNPIQANQHKQLNEVTAVALN